MSAAPFSQSSCPQLPLASSSTKDKNSWDALIAHLLGGKKLVSFPSSPSILLALIDLYTFVVV